MDLNTQPPNDNIRKIEDIIDIQKANGNFSIRQVAFSLPSDTDSAVSATLARSLESGLTRADAAKKKGKKQRSQRQRNPPPDAVSWPSDSDITVLRMKLRLTGAELADRHGDEVPGDGLHRPDSSSMVNLATLMLHSQPPSKQSVCAEEYLLPLTSWERRVVEDKVASPTPIAAAVELSVEPAPLPTPAPRVGPASNCFRAYWSLSSKDSGICTKSSRKSKVARFLRLYFCPCCTCLYEMEKMRDEPSVYLTRRKSVEKDVVEN